MVSPKKIQNQPRNKRIYVYLSEEELKQLDFAADQVGLNRSVFLRKVGLAQQIRPKKSLHAQKLIRKLSKLGAELNKVGSNLNQLAHQANIGNYPSESNLLHVLSAVRQAVDRIVHAIDKV